LIEEPENGIHPGRLKEVLTILRELIQSQEHTQIILTTHSPYVVDLFKPEEVTLCFKDDEGAIQTRRLSESKAVREQIDVFTLGEIWAGDGDERLMEAASASEDADE
jgi:predicted ATPase